MSSTQSDRSRSQGETQTPPKPKFPLAILSVSREEYYGQDENHQPLQLTVKATAAATSDELPPELQGHVFILSIAGSVDSPQVDNSNGEQVVWSAKDGWTPSYNGDGMVYRLSFKHGGASLKNRLAKPPCYYADLATVEPNNQERYQGLRFRNLGISRVSFNTLGVRNQVNTAFLPFKAKGDSSERLLVTWDVGRPIEIDPETLNTLTPVGEQKDWSDLTPVVDPVPFKQIISSAHPCFDPHTNEVFTVNLSKSLLTMFGFSRSIQRRLIENMESLEKPIQDSLLSSPITQLLLKIYGAILRLIDCTIRILTGLEKLSQRFNKNNFVHLLSWDGKQVAITKKWNILLPNNRPFKVDQTMHQMALTKNYIVLAETAFKLVIENFLPFQKSLIANDIKIFIADFSDYPQFPYTKVYLIDRADLKTATPPKKNFFSFFSRDRHQDLPTVIAKEVSFQADKIGLTPEFAHFVVDYDNLDGQITLHASHIAACDVAETIRIFDRSAFDDRDLDEPEDKYDDPELSCRLQKLAGTVVSPMDMSRLGSWIIDGTTGKVVNYKQVDDKNFTWSTSFYACKDEQPTRQLTDIYWNSWGAWPDLLTIRTVEAYDDYPQDQRKISVEEVLDLTYQGIPSSLCRVQINRKTTDGQPDLDLEIVDYYLFKDEHNPEQNYLGTSAQFVPKAGSTEQTDGYIVCVVLTSDEFLSQPPADSSNPDWSQNSEIWIFDAQNLKQGPLYKLSHPKLNFGFTVHTTWLAEAVSPDKLEYDVRADHDHLIAQQKDPELRARIQELFDREVYPQFKQNSQSD